MYQNPIYTNPIYVVDDDGDDEILLHDVLQDLGLPNKLQFFHSAEALLEDLKTNRVIPFIIISDIDLPQMDGFELRRHILEEADITDKSIPFIFWTASVSEAQIKKAYDLSAHGLLLKARTYEELKEGISEIIKYWSISLVPTN
jgi:CheY-like chemotaxis protein